MSFCSSLAEQPDCKTMWVIFIIASLMFLPALGSVGLVNTSDAYYSEAAREMLSRGDFITPYLNFSPFYDKPILTYWLIIASYLSFGVNTFAARLPSALCAIATALVVYSLSRRFVTRRAAFLSALALVAMPLFVIVGHIALTDMPLTLLTTITNLMLLGTLVRGTAKCLIPAYVSLGLALLCKGPLAVVVVATCIGGFLILTSKSLGEFRDRVVSLKPALAISILLAVSLPWFIAEHFASHGEFTNYFFVKQNFDRFSGQLGSHLYPVWFYFPFLLGGFLPSLPLLLTAPVVFRLNKEKRFSKSPRVQITIAACTWFLGTLLLMLVSSSKLPTYLLPLAPPIAILTGIYLDTIIRLGRRRFILWGAPLLVVGGVVSLFVFPQMFQGAEDLRLLATICTIMFVIGYTAYGIFVYKSRIQVGVIVLYLSSILACAALVPIGIQQTYRHGPAALEHLVKFAAASSAQANIAVISAESPKAAFYAQKHVFEIEGPLDCRKFVETTSGPHFMLLDDKSLAILTPFIPQSFKNVRSRGKWHLLYSEQTKAPVQN
jgi:4-amino-4-deoxy-L-arabinose transferase-like glycosyltransferase